MTDTLVARQLGLQVGSRQLIHPLDLELRLGEMITIIGPNGAGKSTLLRLLTGFMPPTQGECLLSGKAYTQWERQALAGKRAVMRQHNPIAFAMTAEEVIYLGVAQRSRAQQRSIVEQVVALIGCSRLLQRNYLTLSGGEQQQIQLARVLAQLWQGEAPQGWLFLDEPTSALDLYHQQHLLRLLHRLTRSGKLMVCSVLHDLNLAATWSDRILVLCQGELKANGSVTEVLTKSQLTQWYQAELTVTQPATQQHPVVLLDK